MYVLEEANENTSIENKTRALLFERSYIHAHVPIENLELSVKNHFYGEAKILSAIIIGLSRKPLFHRTIKRRPDGPWQRMKAKCFPQWLLNLFPVKEVLVEINTTWTWVCPHLVVDNRDKHLTWMLQELGNEDAKAE